MTTYKVNKLEMWGWMHKGFHFKCMLGELTMHLICNFDHENPCNISLNIDYASLPVVVRIDINVHLVKLHIFARCTLRATTLVYEDAHLLWEHVNMILLYPYNRMVGSIFND
jgi:hypothetical protein